MNCIIVFRSITYAQRAKELLAKGGVSGVLVKPSVSLGKGSCSHGIKISNMDLFKAKGLLSSMSAVIGGVYVTSSGGRFQEVKW